MVQMLDRSGQKGGAGELSKLKCIEGVLGKRVFPYQFTLI